KTPLEELDVDGGIKGTGEVCGKYSGIYGTIDSYCIGAQPLEIGELKDNKRCKVSGNKIDCIYDMPFTFSWKIGEYGGCDKTCGGGTQTRSVECKRNDNKIVADSYCSESKPDESKVCNTQVCAVKTILAQNLNINKSGSWSTVLQGPNVNLGGATSGYFLVQFSWSPSIKGGGCPNSRSYARPFVIIDGVKNYISAHRDGRNTTYSYVKYKEFTISNPNVKAGIDVKSRYGNRGSAVNVNKIIYYPTKELMLKDYPSAGLGSHYNGCDNSGVGANP
ncbi:MAG: thrombospondin type-1 domain-containing protein, partial [Candidatus Absconditabacteria bacterium]